MDHSRYIYYEKYEKNDYYTLFPSEEQTVINYVDYEDSGLYLSPGRTYSVLYKILHKVHNNKYEYILVDRMSVHSQININGKIYYYFSKTDISKPDGEQYIRGDRVYGFNSGSDPRIR